MKILSFIMLLLSAGAVYAGDAIPKELYDAICDKNLQKVKSIVTSKSSADIKGNALNLACYCYGASPDIANYLLDIGADPDNFKRGGSAYSTLMHALHSSENRGMKKVLDRVLEKTDDVKFKQSNTKETALHFAAMNGDYDVIEILLKKGADINAKSTGYLEGTKPSTPADYARDEGHMEVALKLEGKDPAVYRTTLHYFAKTGNTAKVKEMIKKGANVNEAEKRSLFTPLYYAVHYNHADTVKALLDAGADPNKVFATAGITALREAVVMEFEPIARILIDAGAKADHIQTMGCGGGLSEFTWATELSQYDLAKYMVEKKAVTPSTPNVFRQRGRNEDVKLAEYMIKKGFQPTHENLEQAKYLQKIGYGEDKGAQKKLIALFEKALEGKPVPAKSLKMGSSANPAAENSKKAAQMSKNEDNPNIQSMKRSLRQIVTE